MKLTCLLGLLLIAAKGYTDPPTQQNLRPYWKPLLNFIIPYDAYVLDKTFEIYIVRGHVYNNSHIVLSYIRSYHASDELADWSGIGLYYEILCVSPPGTKLQLQEGGCTTTSLESQLIPLLNTFYIKYGYYNIPYMGIVLSKTMEGFMQFPTALVKIENVFPSTAAEGCLFYPYDQQIPPESNSTASKPEPPRRIFDYEHYNHGVPKPPTAINSTTTSSTTSTTTTTTTTPPPKTTPFDPDKVNLENICYASDDEEFCTP